MSRIRILSDHLANQIAAGEVVERPASVVKELLENSLDAGSNRITIQVEGGGTRLLRVMDNGMGMNEDDVLLCLERHATSKLQDESQLASIATLGFRGEAIPSIASVSRLTIFSRIADNPTGTKAEIRYGTLHAVHEDGCNKGTIVEVKNLFGNIPARKKFLKTARTELFHIEEVIKNQALANPNVAFSLQVDKRQTLHYPVAELENRMRAVFRYQGKLLELQASGGKNESASLSGFLQLPESVSSSSARLRLLVNGRPVQDRMIRHAVIEGLQGFLMKGHSPAGVLILELSPEGIDVNVHPAKREIRFRNAQDVHRFVTAAVRQAVQLYQEQVRSDLFVSNEPAEQQAKSEPAAEIPSWTPRAMPFQDPVPAPTEQSRIPQPASVVECREPEVLQENKAPQVTPTPSPEEPVKQESVTGLTLIGQLFALYLLCEKDGQLVVIDQHAAHERILYGRLRQAYLEHNVPAQSLLFPVTVELGPDHCDLFDRHQETITQLGLRAAHFGEFTYVIKAVPALISQLAPADIFIETLDALHNTRSGEGGGGIPPVIDSLFASMACKAAIKAGNRLQPQEMLELLGQMEKSKVFSHCPHGRPVIKSFSRSEIEKWFHRT